MFIGGEADAYPERDDKCSQNRYDGEDAHGGLSMALSPGTVKAKETSTMAANFPKAVDVTNQL